MSFTWQMIRCAGNIISVSFLAELVRVFGVVGDGVGLVMEEALTDSSIISL